MVCVFVNVRFSEVMVYFLRRCLFGVFFFTVVLPFSVQVQSHEGPDAEVRYLGNEGLLFSDGETKVLFDPFFHNAYGSYQLVPEETRQAIFNSEPPFDRVSVVVVSHAHGDHFSGEDVMKYLRDNSDVKLVGPQQAIDKVLALDPQLLKQTIGLRLAFGDEPITTSLPGVVIDSVRIPHAGWPQRKDVVNLVHRVTLNQRKTVMHMGDADPDDVHFEPFSTHWQKQISNVAFPPYWFFTSKGGPVILSDRINTLKSVGIHVPVQVPDSLKQSGEEYLSVPNEKVIID